MTCHSYSCRSLICLLLLSILLVPSIHAQTTTASAFGPDYEVSFGLLRDTLYVLDSTYLEVRLDQQKIYQHFRSGRVQAYICSTGDPRIEDGIATREGIFTVQWKSKKYMSQQFGVYLNYWMPFDGGIGFHGLQGRSYYRYLGKRRSSHGCVRISNETGASLFSQVQKGTVVYVHSGAPARVLMFGDSTMQGLRVVEEGDRELLDQRIHDVLDCRWNAPSLTEKLALPARTRLDRGIAVGKADARRVTQRPIPLIRPSALPEHLPTQIPPEALLHPAVYQITDAEELF
jgi:hypothetical protein